MICDFIITSDLIMQISHAKAFKMRNTECPTNMLTTSDSILKFLKSHASKRKTCFEISLRNKKFLSLNPNVGIFFFFKSMYRVLLFFTHKKHPRGASIHEIKELFPLKPSLVYSMSKQCMQNLRLGIFFHYVFS